MIARPSEALIDLNALRHNFRLAQALAPNSKTLAVIKANAYGHGMIQAANALAGEAPVFAIACTDEALALRNAGITEPLLLLEGFFHRDEIEFASHHNLWLMVENHFHIEALLDASLPSPVTVWLKVDSGMHRLGMPLAEAEEAYQRLLASPNVRKPIVIASHFACADEPDNDFTRIQIERIKGLAGKYDAPISLANSPGLIAWPEARGDWNRPGYMLYGNSPMNQPHPNADGLIPVMTMRSRVMSLRKVKSGETVGYGATWRAEKETLIATIPIGYGDGYPRTAPSGTPVLVNGQRARLAGRVSMDLITVDVSEIKGVTLGSEVELWGRHLSVDEVAIPAGTIGYELLTRIPARLRRVYEGR